MNSQLGHQPTADQVFIWVVVGNDGIECWHQHIGLIKCTMITFKLPCEQKRVLAYLLI